MLTVFPLVPPEEPEPMRTVIDQIVHSYQLTPLTQEEVLQVIHRIRDYHAAAYDWQSAKTDEELLRVADASGYLLRTRLRAVIETLDQEYQYGNAQEISIGSLQQESYEDMDPPSLEELNL